MDQCGSIIAQETAGLSLLLCKMETSVSALLPSSRLFILQATATVRQALVASEVPVVPAPRTQWGAGTCRELQLDHMRMTVCSLWGPDTGSWCVKAL